jgi:RNA recognition motif-containing protein
VKNASIAVGNDGRSKGYGVVEYASHEEQVSAICLLNNTELDGRMIICRSDRRSPLEGGRRVYVGNLPWTVAWQDLKDHFRRVMPCGHCVKHPCNF